MAAASQQHTAFTLDALDLEHPQLLLNQGFVFTNSEKVVVVSFTIKLSRSLCLPTL
jgi:hypothetical protein